MKTFNFFCIFIFICMTYCAFGQSRQLFSKDAQGELIRADNYTQIMKELLRNNGGVIKLSNNKEYKLVSFLGAGSTNIIFELSDGRAIRLGYSINGFYSNAESRVYLKSFYDGYKKLKENGINVPKVYKKKSLRSEAVFVEKIDVHFTLEEFKKQTNRASSLSDEKKILLLDQLQVFWDQASHFKHIGDFHANQLIYNGSDWILLDWNDLSIISDEPVKNNNAYAFINQTFDKYRSLFPESTKDVKSCNNFFESMLSLFK